MVAGDNECRMRLYEYRDIGGGILGDLPGHIKAASPQLLDIYIVATPADVAGFLEIDPPTSVLSSSGEVVETISSSADDGNDATDHLQGISAIGIISTNKMVTIQMLAASAAWTETLHTDIWKNIFHCFGSKWGTGDRDPAGAVDIRTVGDLVLVELVAGDNEGNGAAFVVPHGHACMLYGGRLTRITASGAWANDEGVAIRIVYIDAIDALNPGGAGAPGAADRAINWLEFIVAGQYGNQYVDIPRGFMFEEDTSIIHQDSSVVDAGEPYTLHLQYLIWKK